MTGDDAEPMPTAQCPMGIVMSMSEEPMPPAAMGDEARLYGASIAIVSGTYSVVSATIGMGPMGVGGLVMLVVGILVLVHGVVLTTAAAVIGRASGPLMIVWAAIMLLNQLLTATLPGWIMGGSMSWDGGMVAIALIMLASGVIMSRPAAMRYRRPSSAR
jgi:hypothetical protein